MKEYIDRAALKRELAPYAENDFSQQMDVILAIVDAQPAADVVEGRHGKLKNGGNGVYDTCTACESEIYLVMEMNYCPICGVKWDKEYTDEIQE